MCPTTRGRAASNTSALDPSTTISSTRDASQSSTHPFLALLGCADADRQHVADLHTLEQRSTRCAAVASMLLHEYAVLEWTRSRGPRGRARRVRRVISPRGSRCRMPQSLFDAIDAPVPVRSWLPSRPNRSTASAARWLAPGRGVEVVSERELVTALRAVGASRRSAADQRRRQAVVAAAAIRGRGCASISIRR